MVVRQEQEIREFVKTPFYRVIGTFGPAGISIDGEWRAVEGSRYYGTPCLCYKENGFKGAKGRGGADCMAVGTREWKRKFGSHAVRGQLTQKKVDAGLMGVYNTSQGTILKSGKEKGNQNPPLLYNLAELRMIVLKCLKSARIGP